MYSRYDLFAESSVCDSVDNQPYPDPLSVSFNKIQLTSLPKTATISRAGLNKFWYWYYQAYKGATEGDDIMLTLNGIPYVGAISPGDTLYLPSQTDITSPTFTRD